MKELVFEIDESTMAFSIVSKTYGLVTFKFDKEDSNRIKAFSWCVQKHASGFYAFANIGGKRIYLHQLIMSFPINKVVDHISRDSTDNTKKNLREATKAQNKCNISVKKKLKLTKWGYVVEINKKGNYHYLGYEKDYAKAVKMYNDKLMEIDSVFSRTI